MALKMYYMWSLRRHTYRQPSTYARRATPYVDRSFQLKYAKHTLWMVLAASILAYGPLIYLHNENYNLITDLMYSVAPDIVSHLEREKVTLNFSIAIVFISQLLFIAFFSRSMTAKIVGPLKKLRNSLRLLSRGELSSPPLKIREDDEFQDLIASFNYFYSGLQEQTHRDLLNLKELRKLSEHPMQKDQLDNMINEKANQLNIPSQLEAPLIRPLTSSGSDEAGDPRHAS